MSVFTTRLAAVLIPVAALGITSCSGPATSSSVRADFYWSAARETYALGDYTKTADHLEQLIGDDNPYTARAIPWYLAVTGGMANGYRELADQYAAGARRNKSETAAFRAKAAAYRTMANQWAMRLAQNADKLKDIPLGPLPLDFALPKGSAGEPELLSPIANGRELDAADAETAEVVTLQHAVLMAVCAAAGAPQDVAKAEEVLGRVPTEVTRATFGKALAGMLEDASRLYGRNQLDEPQKLAALRERADLVRKEAARVGSARVIEAARAARPNP